TLPGDLISRPFLWDHGVITDLGTLGGDNGEALAINDAGEKLWARPICLATRYSMRSSGVTGQCPTSARLVAAVVHSIAIQPCLPTEPGFSATYLCQKE